MVRRTGPALVAAAFLSAMSLYSLTPRQPEIQLFNDDGGWCWFEDERAMLRDSTLYIGSVASGHSDPRRRGSAEVAVVDLSEGSSQRLTLHEQLELDDHDSPALLDLPDGRVLTAYAKHGSENRFYYRFLNAGRASVELGDEYFFVPSDSSRITYSNLFFLSEENDGKGRVFNFFRGLDNSFKPSFAYSDDLGETWTTGGIVIDVPGTFRHRPYVKYASDGRERIHLLYTEGHPRNYDNSVYHVYYEAGAWHTSDGSLITELPAGLADPAQGTLVFKGSADSVAWVSDLHLDESGRPYGVFSVQKNSGGKPPGDEGQDHRYHYAWWNGEGWYQHQIAFAGSRLYPGEDDYTGNIALDPGLLNCVYISTNVSPRSGAKLPGGRYQVFRGVTGDGGENWHWFSISLGSDQDNIRPIALENGQGRGVVLWLRGKYRAYTDYELEVVGVVPSP